MNTAVIAGILTTVRAIVNWFAAKQGGDVDSALNILQQDDLRGLGLSDDVLELVNYGKAGLAYLTRRGIPVEEAVELIKLAEAENRDLTEAEVDGMLDKASVELDETQAMIDAMRAAEEGGETEEEEDA